MTTRMVPATPGELLVAADQILSSPPCDDEDELLTAHWPWACAILIRLALEAVLDGYWRRMEPSAARCSMRAQLLLLPEFADNVTVRLARDSWLALSRAADYRSDELAPTASELRGWHADVAAVSAELS